MGKIKYRVRKYEPTANQIGTNGFYAEAVRNDEIHTLDLAKKISSKTSFQAPMVEAVLKCVSAQIVEEVLESNRVYLEDENGNTMITIYPKVTGSISQKDVDAMIAAGTKPAGTVVSESLLDPRTFKASAAGTIGTKFNKLIALNASLQKVNSGSAAAEDAPEEGGNTSGGNTGGGSNPDDGDISDGD